MSDELRIVGVAIQLNPSGIVLSLLKPARHCDIINKLEVRLPSDAERDSVQGFLLSSGEFLNRAQAAFHAVNTGEAPKLNHPPDLYSEDLW